MIDSANSITSPVARDALCELVSIGSGNALTSLNRLLGRGSISLSVPQYVASGATEELAGLERPGMLVRLTVEGVVACSFLALFDDDSAFKLAAVLLERDEVEEIATLEESALLEAVNIISCSFLGALGSMVRGVLIPSPPEAEYGRLVDLVRGHVADPMVVLTTSFDDAGMGFSGRIVFLADDRAALGILQAVGVHS